MTSSTSRNSPLLTLWFGNFFEPFYDDADATRRGLAEIASLGFNSINLDSKPWEDFFARYRGEPASTYVAMQELMMSESADLGLDYTCLALYLCGDNLYPTIRDVPPVRGEEAIRPDGRPMGTYKYWSPTAHATMVEHVRGLLARYGDGMHRTPDGRIIMQTMFDPIPKPSFDEEGRTKYLTWLEKRYAGDVGLLNDRYGTDIKGFDELGAEDYWLRPEELSWVGCARPTTEDIERRTPDFHRWLDNQTHLAEIMEEHFATMRTHWDAMETPIFVEPVLHQWGYFFNPPGAEDWQTGQRALDVYRIAKHVDSVLYNAAPLNSENRADATALSVEASIARTANEHRPFTGGLYLGRHVNEDIYAVVPPAEAIATYVAGGAKQLYAYGYSGLDDGGVLFRMDPLFKESVRTGMQWAAEVIPLLTDERPREVAILFPAEMSLYEPLELDHEGRHRMDLLGWHRQFTDLGWHVDIVHPDQVESGALGAYEHLVVPTNSMYEFGGDHAPLVETVRGFVESGGMLWHGPDCALAREVAGIEEHLVEFDCFRWEESDVIPHGWSTVAFTGGRPLASYLQTGATAIAETRLGHGTVISVGFEYGYAYARRTMPIVPPAYGRREMHPIVLLDHTPIETLAGSAPSAILPPTRGLEVARFGNHAIVVNHRSSPAHLGDLAPRDELPQHSGGPGWVNGHSALYLQL